MFHFKAPEANTRDPVGGRATGRRSVAGRGHGGRGGDPGVSGGGRHPGRYNGAPAFTVNLRSFTTLEPWGRGRKEVGGGKRWGEGGKAYGFG